MAQSHRTHSEQTPTPSPTPTPPVPPPPPAPRVMPPLMSPVVSDRQLMEQLRQVYQTANRHLPVPAGTALSQSLTETLAQISDIAQKAVEAYKP